MDENCLKQLGIKIVIISRSRYNCVTTDKFLPSFIPILVPKSEKDRYFVSMPNRKIETLPDNIIGIGAVRNYCVSHYSENTIIMVDDDIQYIFDVTGEKSRKINDPCEVLALFVHLAVLANDAGVHWFGYRNKDIRKYSNSLPFNINTPPSGVVGVIGKKYKFRDDMFKVDIDMTLQNLLDDRIVLIDNRIAIMNKMNTNSGGSVSFKTKETFQKSIDTLKERWGKYIKVKNNKTQDISIRLNVKRRQQNG